MSTYEPWIAYGQTQPIVNGAIDNPAVNCNGLRGECKGLPYVVPAGRELVIEAFGLEAYGNIPGGLVMMPWLGDGPPTNAKGLHSVFSDNQTNETIGARYHLPAGTKFNIRIMSNEQLPAIVGWYVSGKLIEAPPQTCAA